MEKKNEYVWVPFDVRRAVLLFVYARRGDTGGTTEW
jgi:hypothetical protein